MNVLMCTYNTIESEGFICFHSYSFFVSFLLCFQGYFRKAEVQAAAGQYDTSLLLYGRALQLQPNDISILNAAKRIAQLSNADTQCK